MNHVGGKTKLSLWLLSTGYENEWKSGGIAPRIKFVIICRLIICFALRLFSPKNCACCVLDAGRSGRDGEVKILSRISACAINRTPVAQSLHCVSYTIL
jgi:hypothetical protein